MKKIWLSMLFVIVLAACSVFSLARFQDVQLKSQLSKVDSYQPLGFSTYQTIYQQNKEWSAQQIVLIGNLVLENQTLVEKSLDLFSQKDFEEQRFSRYNAFLLKNPTATLNECLMIVNQDLDLLPLQQNQLSLAFALTQEKYYIKKNLKRYLDYYQKEPTLSFDEVVKRVNCQIDYPFYTHTQIADLSKGKWILVNKYYQLPQDYIPNDLMVLPTAYSDDQASLVEEAAMAFEIMCEEAKKEHQIIQADQNNGFRSYGSQQSSYQFYCSAYGVADADEISARPGFSEHQSGYTIDVTVNGSKYNNHHQLDWLMENSYRYGFINRYPENQEYLTGYQHEPWHYRYVGVEAAQIIHDEGLTFEEYYHFYVEDHHITTQEFVQMFQNGG